MTSQHYIQKISDADLKQMTSIPQGGNWQDIPLSIKSKRLDQIREMTKERGVVRTSYYGRLDPQKPSYTIATYYNRPGNGTNLHPNENRVITHREAARLQSFPDSFYFKGSDTSIRNQIGNAVPPLLAFNIGKKLKENNSGKLDFVDLYSGCGGLGYGFVRAGLEHKLSLDNNADCLSTIKHNASNAPVFNVDLGDRSGLVSAIDKIKDLKPRIIIGGPPCQGFSTAGKRLHEDRRNNHIDNFLEIVGESSPDAFIIENVEGILSMQKGEVIKRILKKAKDMGYQINTPLKLFAEQFGVPQMRRRIFIVGTKNNFVFNPPEPLFQRCLGRREASTNIDLFSLAYPITVGEAFCGLQKLGKTQFKGKLTFDKSLKLYSDFITGFIGEDALLNKRGHYLKRPQRID